MSDELLTPKELGEIYKVSGSTIRSWHRKGTIPAEVNEGNVLRFDADEVDAVLKARARKKAKTKTQAFLA